MSLESDINKINEKIAAAIDKLRNSIPSIQDNSYDKFVQVIKDLKISDDGNLINTGVNYRLVSKLKNDISDAILSEKYLKQVADYVNAFKEIAELHNEYFKNQVSSFSPSDVNKLMLKTAIENTVESLTESGINERVIVKAEQILKDSVAAGAKYTDVLKQMKAFLTNTEGGDGALLRYVKQITVDTLNQFSRNYNQAITVDLKFDWFYYVGSLIQTSREFCVLCVKKKYIHRSEFPTILGGLIDGEHIELNPKTKLPKGLIEGTNPSNFQTLAGGNGCDHQVAGISAAFVPKSIRDKFQ